MLRIPVTGGPCGGKSTAQSHLIQSLEDRLGMKVFWVPETASELILNGIVPGDKISFLDFQKFVLEKQLSKESLYDKAASYYDPDKTIIFYDRGIMDNAAYIGMDAFKDLLQEYNLSVYEVYAKYDAVLHLVTAAQGAEEFYQWNDPTKPECGNNAARSEPPELAREIDLKTRNAWVGHPHLRIFENTCSFDEKIAMVENEVFSLLGEPAPMEIERKFLIRRPDEEKIGNLGYTSKTNIVQVYLNSHGDVERRVRQRGTKEFGYSFYYTEKTDVSLGKRIEREYKISRDDYIGFLADADVHLRHIVKDRHCFVHSGRYFEMDLYHGLDEYAILEVELNSMDEKVDMPDLEVIREVTDDPRFRNHFIAKLEPEQFHAMCVSTEH